MTNVVKQIGEQMEKLGLSVGGGRTRSERNMDYQVYSKKVRKQRSNKGVKRGPMSGKTRSGRRFKGVVNKSMKRIMKSLTPKKESKKVRKQRSNKGVKRGPRTGKTRSGRRFRQRA